ncbi:hypothetical protein ACQPZG_16905 [Streptomyces sp. CA-294286]|uniref:hypothetical protein n=1 Tax=Streptomyces sp. CA-294286 TaxID=3240070 RepID=UPI003D9090C3
MAVEQLSPAPSRPAHPMSAPGYGKRTAPHQLPRAGSDFDHLAHRESAIAHYIDRLPEGANIGIKALAQEIAGYGQMAVSSALRKLEAAGHLFHQVDTVVDADGRTLRVTRTYFSRTARPDAWWRSHLTDEETENHPEEVADTPGEPERRAYRALSRLSHRTPKLPLSDNECVELIPYAAEWFRRGASEERLMNSLALILPPVVFSPFAFVQRKLVKQLPPPLPEPRQGRPILECRECGVPGEAAALPGGLCRPCRSQPYVPARPGLPAETVHGKAASLRHQLRAAWPPKGLRGGGGLALGTA